MANSSTLKKIGEELFLYRKKQYLLLKILVFMLAVFEVCILVVMFNEAIVLSNGETFNITVVGIFVLICLFCITFYSIVYVNFYMDKKNFKTLLKCGFTKKELVKSIRMFGRNMFLKYLLLGGIIGTGAGLLLTWKYKQKGSVLISVVLICIIYLMIQAVLKKCIKKILEPVNINIRKKESQKLNFPKIINIFDVSIKYICFNIKRVVSVGVIMFTGGFLISYSCSMIKSISLEQYILDTWGYADYKIILYKDGDMTGNYYSLQENNPLTEKMKQNILQIQGVKDVVPRYSVQAVLDINGEKVETSIVELDDDVKKSTGIEYINKDEIIISTRTSYLTHIQELIEKSVSIDFFDGNKEKNKIFEVANVIVDDSKATTIYATRQCIEEMTENLPILSFYIYAEQNKEIFSKIVTIIKGKTLELNDMDSYITEAKKGFDVIIIGIVSIMIILIFFAVSILLNSKFLNMIVRKNDFKILQILGMCHADIKKMILIENLIISCSTIIVSWITGLCMCHMTCNGMKKIGSTFWLFKPAYNSLFWCIVLSGVMLYIEFKIYKYMIENQ